MFDQYEAADFVIAVCTETYERRALGREEPQVGRGVTWEGGIMTQELYEGRRDGKVIPVVFGSDDRQYVPHFLRGTSVYSIQPDSLEGLEAVLRRIWNEPEYVAERVSERPSFNANAATPDRAADEQQALPPVAGRLDPSWIENQRRDNAFGLASSEALRSEYLAGTASQDEVLLTLRSSIEAFAHGMSEQAGKPARVVVWSARVGAEPDDSAIGSIRLMPISTSSSVLDVDPPRSEVSPADATEFQALLTGPNASYFLSNDLDNVSYSNPSMKSVGKHRSCIVVPLQVILADGEFHLLGFLGLYSQSRRTFSESRDLALVQLYAGCVTPVLRQLADPSGI